MAKRIVRMIEVTDGYKGLYLGGCAQNVIFLDIDGVLHRNENSSLEFIGNFELLMKGVKNTSICFSTDWRLFYSFEELKGYFSPEVQEKIVGCTPEFTRRYSEYERLDEIRAWLSEHGLRNKTFVAIDDNESLFEPGFDRLIKTRKSRGLSDEELSRVIEEVRSLLIS